MYSFLRQLEPSRKTLKQLAMCVTFDRPDRLLSLPDKAASPRVSPSTPRL